MCNKGTIETIKLIAGRSNPQLSQAISDRLGIPLTKCTLDNFNNSESRVEIGEDIRGYNIFIIQTGTFSKDLGLSTNDFLMETFSLINACRLSGSKSISVILPCFPYARSDKKDVPRVPINGALVTNLLKSCGVKRIVSMDLHSGQIQGFTDLPFDNLYGIKLFVQHLRKGIFKGLSQEEINQRYVLVSPDNGGTKRVEAYARQLGMSMVIMHKSRDYTQKSKVLKSTLIGDPETVIGKTGIVIDDMVDTCGTMVSTMGELKDHGIKDAIILATHGVLSGPALERLLSCDTITKVIITNTIPQNSNCQICPKLEVVDTSNLFAEVIKRIIVGGSISELFKFS